MPRPYRWLPALVALLLGPAAALHALDPPLLTLTYETARGIEEDEEQELEPTYVRHTVAASLRLDLAKVR